jgi:hypothetical protein
MKVFNKLQTFSKSSLIQSYKQTPKLSSFNKVANANFTVMSHNNPEVKVRNTI